MTAEKSVTFTLQVFGVEGAYDWSLVQEFDDGVPEAIAYGTADTFNDAIRFAGNEMQEIIPPKEKVEL